VAEPMRAPSTSRRRYCPFCDAYTEQASCSAHLLQTVDLGGLPGPPVHQLTPPGTIFANRFEIESVLGTGQSGTIFKARQISMNRSVALKVLHAELLREPGALRRFYLEVRTATPIEHPHIVRIFDFGVDEQTHQPYIAMNLIEGRSLSAILSQGPLTEMRAARILAQVARALLAAHAKGIVHRDLKPENIIVSTLPDGMEHATVVDFGTARSSSITGSVGATAERQGLFGTPLYMSPEQIAGVPSDGRSDLYALGCILHEGVAGQAPFDRENVLACLLAHLEVQPPPLPSRLVDGAAPSAALTLLIRWLLAKQKEERPPSAQKVIEILSRIAAGDQSSALEILSSSASDPDRTSPSGVLPGPEWNGPLDDATVSDKTLPDAALSRGRSLGDSTAGALLTLPAVIDGSFAFEIEAVRDKGVLVFDFDRVRRITSFGVREWSHFLKQLPPQTYYCFVRCHASAVAQLNFVSDFGARGELLSLYAPYECPRCGDRVELLIDAYKEKENIDALELPSLRCSRCLIEVELDESPEVYFDYVIRSQRPNPPPAVQELLSGAGVQHQRSREFGVTKDVGDSLTVFRLSGLLDDRASFRWLAEGVEGAVLVDFGGLSGVVGGGFAKLIQFLRDLDCPVYLVNSDLQLVEQLLASPLTIDVRLAMIEGKVVCDKCGTLRRARIGPKELGVTCCGQKPRVVAAIERLAPKRRSLSKNEEIERYLESISGD
jgi:serine/threonine protein kinase